jgi:hypothetical protein
MVAWHSRKIKKARSLARKSTIPQGVMCHPADAIKKISMAEVRTMDF